MRAWLARGGARPRRCARLLARARRGGARALRSRHQLRTGHPQQPAARRVRARRSPPATPAAAAARCSTVALDYDPRAHTTDNARRAGRGGVRRAAPRTASQRGADAFRTAARRDARAHGCRSGTRRRWSACTSAAGARSSSGRPSASPRSRGGWRSIVRRDHRARPARRTIARMVDRSRAALPRAAASSTSPATSTC